MALEIDHAFDGESIGSASSKSYTTSIATYIKEGVEENGRRYASYGKGIYGMPIDEEEQDRNDIQHAKFTLLLGEKLFLAPIEKPSKILDLGTGSGVWAIDVADQFEDAQITGVDIAPIQPHFVPPNCSFELLDVEDDWLLPKDSFDFINARELMLSIRDWDSLCKRAFDHIKPGGYFEVQGSLPLIESDDDTIPPDSALNEMSKIFFRMAKAMGTDGEVPTLWKGMLEKAGFINVEQRVFKVPQGPWAKDPTLKKIGAFENYALISGLDAYMRRGYTQILKGDPAVLDKLMDGTVREARDPKIHTYCTYYDVYGQRPLN